MSAAKIKRRPLLRQKTSPHKSCSYNMSAASWLWGERFVHCRILWTRGEECADVDTETFWYKKTQDL